MRSEIEENVKTTKKMEWQNYKNAKKSVFNEIQNCTQLHEANA